jgi:hypothetical protein
MVVASPRVDEESLGRLRRALRRFMVGDIGIGGVCRVLEGPKTVTF